MEPARTLKALLNALATLVSPPGQCKSVKISMSVKNRVLGINARFDVTTYLGRSGVFVLMGMLWLLMDDTAKVQFL